MIVRLKISAIFLILFQNGLLYCQTESFYTKNSYFLVSIGIMLNHPLENNSVFGIKRAMSLDPQLNLSWLTFRGKSGWQWRVGGGTQSVRYKHINERGSYTTANAYSSGDGAYHLNINKTYNFNLARRLNAILAVGPIAFFNRYTHFQDSVYNAQYSDFIAYNVKPIGFGISAAGNFVYKHSDKSFFTLTIAYQRGLVRYREARVTNSARTEELILNYNGSGSSITVGYLFSLKTK